MKQTTFAGMAYGMKKKRTRREQFLGEMEAVMPCTAIAPPGAKIIDTAPKTRAYAIA